MRARTWLTVLFLIPIGVAGLVLLHALSQKGAAPGATKDQILVATMPLPAGTLLRAQDVAWHAAAGPAGGDQIVPPLAAALAARPELSEESRAEVYGAGLREPFPIGDPIRRTAIVKPAHGAFRQAGR